MSDLEKEIEYWNGSHDISSDLPEKEKCHYCEADAEICDPHRRGFMVCATCYDNQSKERIEDE